MTAEPLTPEDLRPARAGGFRRLTFDNGRHEDYQAVFVQHSAGEWDRILIARDDGRIAALLADLINGVAARAAHTPSAGAGLREAALALVGEWDRLEVAWRAYAAGPGIDPPDFIAQPRIEAAEMGLRAALRDSEDGT